MERTSPVPDELDEVFQFQQIPLYDNTGAALPPGVYRLRVDAGATGARSAEALIRIR